MNEANPPFFVVGSERSGSTLLGYMLSGHPQLALVRGGEFDRSVALVGDDGRRPPIEELVAFAETDFEFYMTGEHIDPSQSHDENVHRWMTEARERADAVMAGGVVHKHFSRLPFVFPDARYIHLIRDGRDVTMSCIKKGWGHDVWHAADVWLEAERQWDLLEARIAAEAAMQIRYEDLVRDARGELERVCSFLGVDQRVSEMLAYSESSSYEAPHLVMVDAWTRWPPRDIQLAEARMGEVLAARGYRLSGLHPHVPSRLERLALKVRGRAKGVRERVGEHGPLVTLGDVVGRKVGSERLQSWATKRINEATRENLTHVSAGVTEVRGGSDDPS